MKLRAGSTLSGGTSYPTPYVCDVKADRRTAVDRQPSDRAVESIAGKGQIDDRRHGDVADARDAPQPTILLGKIGWPGRWNVCELTRTVYYSSVMYYAALLSLIRKV